MTIDQILKIELPGDATSGKDWRKIAYADSLIVKSGKPNYMLGDGGGGSPGVYYFRFKAIAAGTSQLYLEYGSKYDSDENPTKKFEITVVVHEKVK
jgi:predicted secreted protein